MGEVLSPTGPLRQSPSISFFDNVSSRRPRHPRLAASPSGFHRLLRRRLPAQNRTFSISATPFLLRDYLSPSFRASLVPDFDGAVQVAAELNSAIISVSDASYRVAKSHPRSLHNGLTASFQDQEAAPVHFKFPFCLGHA
ncbi:hypothetical protein HPP92_015627 [Vanilla planifolia]|uniref:Uncharacterized protein n=1 Tax=Vanilla planifolia TaxID=51239 RepID=A0A835QDC9_VANPL|nr:hypothetical protein HPP92_016444 [Vanilla planifolia]KAG0471081.1 hypothetical protein HPP92_015627 [Vanilla planifolia]